MSGRARPAHAARYLSDNVPLLTETGHRVRAGDLLRDPERWHGTTFTDPGGKVTGWANLCGGATPCLMLEDGRRLRLTRPRRALDLVKGDVSAAVAICVADLQAAGEVFDRGGERVILADDGRVLPVCQHWLRVHLGELFDFRQVREGRDGAEARPVDASLELAAAVLAAARRADFPALRGVITAPCLRADGSLLDRPGYDRASGLLYRLPPGASVSSGIPQAPDTAAALAAWRVLWQPFAEFPCVDDTARGVLAAAMLTAAVRPSLPAAPAFAFDAPTAGTGKTLIASCVGALAIGQAPAVTPWPESEADGQKLLFALAREASGAVLIDNIERPLSSSTLNAALTSGVVRDRVLGASATAAAPCDGLLLLTGNNLTLNGDLNRRVLRCRLDSGEENPWRGRAYALDPRAHCIREYMALRCAALTVLLAFGASGYGRSSPERMASFEAWDDRVRQAVLWLDEIGVAGLGDPLASIEASASTDPDRAKLARLLQVWHAAFGNEPARVADVIRQAEAARDADRETKRSAAWTEPPDPSALELWDVLDEIAGDHGKLNARRLGRWIEGHKDRPCDGLAFRRGKDDRTKVATWYVEAREGG